VANGAVTAYQGDAGFSRTPASGDVMVEIPKFWYKIDSTPGGNLDIYIASGPTDGYSVSPAHCDREDGKGEREKVYVGAYTSNSEYRSISGNASLVSKTRAEFRTGHSGRGAGYCTIDFATWWTIAMLYLVEYANTDSQSSVGRGYSDGNKAQINTGGANSIGGGDTAAHHTGTAGSSIGENAVTKYRHMENLWGNISWFVDGIVFSDTAVYICLNPANFGDTTANHINLGITRANASGCISDLAVPSNYPWAMYPSAVDGSDSTFVPDYCYYDSSGVNEYSDWRKKTLENVQNNVIVESDKQLADLVKEAFEDKQSKKSLHLGVVPQSSIDRINSETFGVPKDLRGYLFKADREYSLEIGQEYIRHLADEKDSLTVEDAIDYVVKLPVIVTQFDSSQFTYYEQGANRLRALKFTKRMPDGTYMSLEVVSRKKINSKRIIFTWIAHRM